MVEFADGFEDGTLDAWTAISDPDVGEVAVQQAVVAHGANAVRLDIDDADTLSMQKTFSSLTEVWWRFYFRFAMTTWQLNDYILLTRLGGTGHTYAQYVYLRNEGGTIYYMPGYADMGGNNYLLSGGDRPIIVPDKWYCFEGHWKRETGGGGDGQVHFWNDGVLIGSKEDIDHQPTADIDYWYGLRTESVSAPADITFYGDDFALSDAGRIYPLVRVQEHHYRSLRSA